MDVIQYCKELGADLAGIASVEALRQRGALQEEVLKGAQSAVVIAVAHSTGALRSSNIQVKQYDTRYTYSKVDEVAHRMARALEGEGYPSVAIPAYIPLDMGEGKQGMVGLVDHRQAAREAGLGTLGLNNLLVTREFGPRVRLGCVLTTAPLLPTLPLKEDVCTGCKLCWEKCPSQAFLEPGQIDKTKCMRSLFLYGLRGLLRFGHQMIDSTSPQERKDLMRSEALRELWQNFMSGSYYYCFECQAQCPLPEGGNKP